MVKHAALWHVRWWLWERTEELLTRLLYRLDPDQRRRDEER